MKKFCMLLLGLVLMTPWISAGNDPGIESLIIKMEQETPGNHFIVQIANLQQITTSITLTNDQGKTLHRNRIKNANGRQIKYTLKDFEDGHYQITIEWNKASITWQLLKKGDQIKFQPISESLSSQAG